MENKSNQKKIILISVCVAVAVIIALVIWLLNKEESYRVVKIYELDGIATVTREETGEIDIYPNMVLASGDEVYLQEGLMTLKLDEDKYVYVEENTRFTLLATGNAATSKTSIELIEGAIVNEIRSPLPQDASYEVHTQNSSMSVRGTTFRVAIYYDEDGTLYTKVSVFDGKVETQLVYKDGTKADPRMVEFGKETIIYEDNMNTDYLEGITDIKYEELSVSAIETLLELVKDGLVLSASEADLGEILAALTGENGDAEEPKQAEDDEEEADQQEEESEEGEAEDGENPQDEASDDATEEEEEETPSSPAGNTVTYKVTFVYNGTTFATQTVASGGCATQPTLMPAPSGSWDFDFSTAITEDTTVNWK